MKEIVTRATMVTDTVYNTGFLHIKDSVIEGIFSLDYVRISLDGKQMVFDWKEQILDFDVFHNFCSRIQLSCYSTPYRHEFLYIPDTYSLSDERGSFLSLSLEEPIYDFVQISRILQKIDLIRF